MSLGGGKLNRLKPDLARTHNYSSGLVPINSLPPEILTHIFRLLRPKPCQLHKLSYYDNEVKTIEYPTYPDYLAQVCTLWRQVAMASRSLWTHIDLSPQDHWFDEFVGRAEQYLTRSDPLPVELHVSEGNDCLIRAYSILLGYEYLCKLIYRNSSRVETLEMFVSGDFGGLYRDLLGNLLCGQRLCLTKLAIRSGAYHHDKFITPDFFDPTSSGEEPDIFASIPSVQQIESAFARLTALHLRGIFPLWSSLAYQGLVDLRLLSTSQWSHIRESQLVSILKSSPGLRILHFGLKILSPTPGIAPETPVYLEDLRVFKIFTFAQADSDVCHSRVLRLVSPGPKPLRLSFEDGYSLNDDVIIELDRFFARSIVEIFYTSLCVPPISLFIRHSAHVERVICNDIDISHCLDLHSELLEMNDTPTDAYLKSLYFVGTSLTDIELGKFLAFCPTGIVLDTCRVYYEDDEKPEYIRFTEKEISDTFPQVKVNSDGYQVSTDDWDFID
ncbi:unnamed protein product [Rhizoctonia solani]|uniref:F-box domain-containing protein n=1 Tax=Rhizoctonia solani TaxID=456999 RepID=A0A8H3AVR9_9AGAM|nr:unnamed protein product [Rhizoctonia solani]